MVGRDHLLVDTDKCNVEWNIDRFFQKDFESLNQLKITTNDTKSWQKESVFTKTNADEVKSSIRMMQYRGFDVRYLAYNRDIVEGHRMGYIDQISGKPLWSKATWKEKKICRKSIRQILKIPRGQGCCL